MSALVFTKQTGDLHLIKLLFFFFFIRLVWNQNALTNDAVAPEDER